MMISCFILVKIELISDIKGLQKVLINLVEYSEILDLANVSQNIKSNSKMEKLL